MLLVPALALGAMLLPAVESCQGCHADKAASYSRVSMAQTLAPVAKVNVIEDYTKENHFFHRASGEHFRMFSRDGKYYQRRYQLDEHGTQLPVTWYTQEKRWGMSPGYDRPGHYEFGRVIDTGCLFCHNAYPAWKIAMAAVRSFASACPRGSTASAAMGARSMHSPMRIPVARVSSSAWAGRSSVRRSSCCSS